MLTSSENLILHMLLITLEEVSEIGVLNCMLVSSVVCLPNCFSLSNNYRFICLFTISFYSNCFQSYIQIQYHIFFYWKNFFSSCFPTLLFCCLLHFTIFFSIQLLIFLKNCDIHLLFPTFYFRFCKW